MSLYVLFCSFVTKINLNLRGIKHQKLKSNGFPLIKGKDIIIGNNFLINNTLRSNPVGYVHRSVIIAYKGAKIRIGNDVGMSHVTIVASKEITIDRNVMLGGGVCIYDSDFHSLDYKLRGTNDDMSNAISKPIHIEKNVFIGTGTTILKGVTIGENSIIGACSIVTKNIPPNEVWGGCPASFIRKLI